MTLNKDETEDDMYNCPCGSVLKNTKQNISNHRHKLRHKRYESEGEVYEKRTTSQYQRDRFAKNTVLREKQRRVCQSYYWKNKEDINRRHAHNRLVHRTG